MTATKTHTRKPASIANLIKDHALEYGMNPALESGYWGMTEAEEQMEREMADAMNPALEDVEYDATATPEQLEPTPEHLPNSSEQLSQSPAFLFILAAVAILVIGKAFVGCAVLAFNLGRKIVDAAINARTPKINFSVYKPIFEGLE